MTRHEQVGGEHYLHMNVQPWDVVDQWSIEQRIGFYRGNAVKYLMRAGSKGSMQQDIAKAHHLVEKLMSVLKEKNNDSVSAVDS